VSIQSDITELKSAAISSEHNVGALQQKIDSIHAQQDEAMEVPTINLKREDDIALHSNANTLLDTTI
jgi:hypothetical protein